MQAMHESFCQHVVACVLGTCLTVPASSKPQSHALSLHNETSSVDSRLFNAEPSCIHSWVFFTDALGATVRVQC